NRTCGYAKHRWRRPWFSGHERRGARWKSPVSLPVVGISGERLSPRSKFDPARRPNSSAGEDQRDVVPTEPERVVQARDERDLAVLSGHVDLDVRVEFVEVAGARDDALLDGQQSGDALDSPGGAEHVAGHRLGGSDDGVVADGPQD